MRIPAPRSHVEAAREVNGFIIMPTHDTWTRTHDLALLFVALAYGTDYQLSDEELATITDKLRGWRNDFTVEQVQETVVEAMAIFLEDGAEHEVHRAIYELKDGLSEEERRRALEEVVQIAEADGILLNSEQSLISVVAEAWGLKEAGRRYIEESAVSVEGAEGWSLLHDITLIYIVLAHSTDNDLSEDEISAMIECLDEWQPDLQEDGIRTVLREALGFYAQGPDPAALQRSIEAIKDGLPLLQRLALLDDLVYIARVDGELTEHERDMLASLSSAWDIGIRLNGLASRQNRSA